MHSLRHIGVLTLCAWFAIAVPHSAQSPFSHGLIQGSCAPWDGPAIDVTLTKEPAQCKKEPGGPFVEIGVWKGLPLHAGQEVQFEPGSSTGFGTYCEKAGQCERAESGTIVFEKYKEGSGASGHYELHFKSGKTLAGSFDAKWCDNRALCG